MRIEEKIRLFSDLSLKDAEKRREDLLRELDDKLAEARERLTKEAQRRRDKTIDDERRKFAQLRNREALNAHVEARRSLIDLRAQLMDDLFERVREKLDDYMTTQAYTDRLADGINAAARAYGGLTATVRPVDLGRVRAFVADNVKLEAGDSAMIGGFIAEAPEKHVTIDNSFRAKLIDARENFKGFQIIETE